MFFGIFIISFLMMYRCFSFHTASKTLTSNCRPTIGRHASTFLCMVDKRKPRDKGFNGYTQSLTKREAYTIASSEVSGSLPCVILVNPFLDKNVGSVSRAMLNFGMTDLRVVDPVCDILSDDARALAVGSIDVLESARVFPTLEEAIKDLNRVFATTVRPRSMTQMVLTPEAAAATVLESAKDARDKGEEESFKSGIVFGRERSGLTNEETALADVVINIPTFKHFSSLNLAQAVNIVGYEIWKQNLELNGGNPNITGGDTRKPDVWLHPKDGERLSRRDELDAFTKRLEEALDFANYQPDEQRRASCYRNIKNVFQRTLMTKTEVDLMHGVLSSLISPRKMD